MPNGFSMITRTSASLVVLELGVSELLDDHREELRRGRQVEGAVHRFAGLLVEAVEHLAELAVDRRVIEHAGHVAHVVQQLFQHVLVGRTARVLADRFFALGAITLVRLFFA